MRIHIHCQRHYIKVRTIEGHKLFSGLATNMCSTNDHFYIYEPIFTEGELLCTARI